MKLANDALDTAKCQELMKQIFAPEFFTEAPDNMESQVLGIMLLVYRQGKVDGVMQMQEELIKQIELNKKSTEGSDESKGNRIKSE